MRQFAVPGLLSEERHSLKHLHRMAFQYHYCVCFCWSICYCLNLCNYVFASVILGDPGTSRCGEKFHERSNVVESIVIKESITGISLFVYNDFRRSCLACSHCQGSSFVLPLLLHISSLYLPMSTSADKIFSTFLITSSSFSSHCFRGIKLWFGHQMMLTVDFPFVSASMNSSQSRPSCRSWSDS